MLYTLNQINKIVKKINIQKSLPILLHGEMGAGKTTLTKAIINQILDINTINFSSPTFNIINHYKYQNINIYHCDLSRITNPNDEIITYILESLENSIYIIEWPEIIRQHLLQYISIKISFIDDITRKIEIVKK